MPVLRPTQARTIRCLRTTSKPTLSKSSRTFTSTLRPLSDDSHGSHYDPPTGWLWGIQPGTKYEKEGWEGITYWGFCGGVILTAVAYGFKPDTSIQTWALEEARRRLEVEGILEDPESEKK
jgi:hypothetical protein